ncbi:mitochondrial import inner membrane translocase subunit TIM44 isoform X1 [Neodiprion pinetum]|uniref:mitochondrial import inner membrane translocase subunit TIM44 isoform X1 n=1 Tax=Neodiprion fabricii TaxID=2872261 RepID=UPI001ED9694D|nr:mitochondrial import inner membrane translocase subunit TIM44 isoform X1 [Neodiprion fabricii]XP_046486219.1 mitochondrial import inner membrane translocase subunit TIM44 isoform X1 [Neodiprion pinetum]
MNCKNCIAGKSNFIGIVRAARFPYRYSNGYRDISQIWSVNQMLRQIEESSSTSIHMRLYSSPARRPNFFSQFVENIRQEMQKNKEMKESLKKFREEAEKLEQSDALKSARQKFQTVESEANKSSEVIKERLDHLKEKVQGVLEEASKSEIGKKAGQLGEEITKSAKDAAETISEKSQAIGKTGAFQTISQTAEAVRKEFDQQGIQARVYVPPKKLRKRKEVPDIVDEKQVEANEEATGVELHKDSKFYQSWQNFKDNNPYVNKVWDWKMKYEESDNPMIRASRLLTDKVTDIMGGLFQKTELSETLTAICKLDPNFDKVKFLRDCETDIIPNILEAMVRGDLDTLKDWCHEAPYNLISQPLTQAKKLGYYLDSKILDIDNVDLVMGKVMEQGPVLIITFQSQQIMCVRNAKNEVIEGDPEKVMRVNYVWVLCRDPTELNPRAAWRLLDLSANSAEQFL